ncbi:melatonin receptor type 1C-like [Saccoglossus kowalevskii]|uniref:Melatonin receptor type 1C-like n=1 Tax=Saccoglossus kowalevskii TaxID=10224 RepID=A0ABM0MAA1_SACKO|nr:PREDICTED: melatonin receptor type 1C-like [Saccoglossus kowalevskii]
MAIENLGWNTSSADNNSIADVHAIIPPNIVLKVVCVAALIMTLVVGVVGNILAMVSITMFKQLRSPSNVIVGGLCISDFTTCTVMTIITIASYLSEGQIFGYLKDGILGNGVCQVYGFLFIQSGGASIYCMVAIAINRYICVCRKHLFLAMFTIKNSVFCVVACHALAAVFSLPPFFNFSRYIFTRNEYICLMDRTGLGLYYLASLATGTGLVPLLIIGTCYIQIGLKIRQVQRQIHSQSGHISKRDIQVTKTLFVVFLSYVLSISPYQFIATFDHSRDPPFGLAVLFFSSSAINPVIYGMMNPQFRRAYRKILKPIGSHPQNNSIEIIVPGPSTTLSIIGQSTDNYNLKEITPKLQ